MTLCKLWKGKLSVLMKFGKISCTYVLAILLVACSSHTIQPTAKLAELSSNNFMFSLRWKSYQTAARLMLPEFRQKFVKTFTSLKDVDITDVRLVDLKISEEGMRFETTMAMDYYLLPSVTVKTFSFDQTWLFFAGEDPAKQGYLITTPFPDFP